MIPGQIQIGYVKLHFYIRCKDESVEIRTSSNLICVELCLCKVGCYTDLITCARRAIFFTSYPILSSLHTVHCCVCVSLSVGWSRAVRCVKPEAEVWSADWWAPLQTSCRPRPCCRRSLQRSAAMIPFDTAEKKVTGGAWFDIALNYLPAGKQTPQRRVLQLLSSATLKWTKSGFGFWWFWCFIKVSLT